MALPTRPKREPKTVSVSMRLSSKAAETLKSLARDHNLSQADVVEHLILNERSSQDSKKKR